MRKYFKKRKIFFYTFLISSTYAVIASSFDKFLTEFHASHLARSTTLNIPGLDLLHGPEVACLK
jgi:hypothetical protein